MSDPLIARLRALLGPDEPEIACEECFDLLDAYVEAERAGARADQLVPGMRAHLLGCPACAEEHAGLHALLDADAPDAGDDPAA